MYWHAGTLFFLSVDTGTLKALLIYYNRRPKIKRYGRRFVLLFYDVFYYFCQKPPPRPDCPVCLAAGWPQSLPDRSRQICRNKKRRSKNAFLLRRGAANRGRTGTEFLPRDFKSLVSAYSTIAARYCVYYFTTALQHCQTASARQTSWNMIQYFIMPFVRPCKQQRKGGVRIWQTNTPLTEESCFSSQADCWACSCF